MGDGKEKLDTSHLSKEGDKRFKEEMKKAFSAREGIPIADGKEEAEEWQDLLDKVGKSIKIDAAFRKGVKHWTDDPQMSEQLRGHLLALITMAEEMEGIRFDHIRSITKKLMLKPEAAEKPAGRIFSDHELEEYASSLLKNPEWKKDIMATKDPEKLLMIGEIFRNPQVKVSPELREFLDNLLKMTQEVITKLSTLSNQLFPEGMPKGVEAFAKEVKNKPDWKKYTDDSLKNSPEFRVKAAIASSMAFVLPAQIPSDVADYLRTAITEYEGGIFEDMMNLSGVDIKEFEAQWGKVLGEDAVHSVLKGSVRGQSPEKAPESSQGKPVEAPVKGQSGEAPQKQSVGKESGSGPAPKEKEKDKEGFKLPDVKNMDMAGLFGELVKAGMDLKEKWDALWGGKESPLKNLEKALTNKYTDDNLNHISINLAKNAEKKDYTQDKSVQYVTSVLGLPERESVQLFLDALVNEVSERVLIRDQNRMKEIKVGDLLFFQKENDKKEKVPYLTAVVSGTDPLTMKTIPVTGGAPVEMNVIESDYFKNHWMGFIKLPAKSPSSTSDKAPEPAMDQKLEAPSQ